MIIGRVCPHCNGMNVHRSRYRSTWGRIVGLLGLQPYRCHDCRRITLGWRFRNPRTPFDDITS